jgi:hypothetical protein
LSILTSQNYTETLALFFEFLDQKRVNWVKERVIVPEWFTS